MLAVFNLFPAVCDPHPINDPADQRCYFHELTQIGQKAQAEKNTHCHTNLIGRFFDFFRIGTSFIFFKGKGRWKGKLSLNRF